MNSARIAKQIEKRLMSMEKLCQEMNIDYLGSKEELF